ncbi:MAG: branched-chain amino acid transport system permease protein [Bacillota bacterium]|nr:branched-chain amino acid transport system permease protein [Bacillota bacterium]
MNAYVLQVLILTGINIVLALGLNLISGLTGQLSLGHAAFMGIGAYAAALLTKAGYPFFRRSWPVPYWPPRPAYLSASLLCGCAGTTWP